MTLLKRSLFDPHTKKIVMEDIDDSTQISYTYLTSITLNLENHGTIDGFVWVEEHSETWVPWILVFLFFWCIKPKITYRMMVNLIQGEKHVAFSFKYDSEKSIEENLSTAPKSLGIKEVWLN